jgi:hypothetical protein
MAKLKYFGMAAAYKSIESVRNLRIGDACYSSGKNLLSSCLHLGTHRIKYAEVCMYFCSVWICYLVSGTGEEG